MAQCANGDKAVKRNVNSLAGEAKEALLAWLPSRGSRRGANASSRCPLCNSHAEAGHMLDEMPLRWRMLEGA